MSYNSKAGMESRQKIHGRPIGILTSIKNSLIIVMLITAMVSCGKEKEPEKEKVIEATGISLDKTELGLVIGELAGLKATITPDDATDKTIEWSTSNASVVIVNVLGNVTALAAGTATVTATTGGNRTAVCNVSVADGSEEYPFLVASKDDLKKIGTQPYNLDKHYRQIADIDLENEEWRPLGSHNTLFSGFFDGAGHSIANLNITSRGHYKGLFYGLASGGHIYNVHVISGSITGGEHNIGGIVGFCSRNALVSFCSNAATIYSTVEQDTRYVGGICGRNEGTISECTNTGAVTGHWMIGGICGSNEEKGVVSKCSNTGDLLSDIGLNVGGICGMNHNKCLIIECFNIGNIYGSGICAVNGSSSVIKSCYNAGQISGNGGVCGGNYSGSSIIACYNVGDVSIKNGSTGGICGNLRDSSVIIACYNTGDISGTDTGTSSGTGGICGEQRLNSLIVSCYNTGLVSGNIQGGICGTNNNAARISCYWAKYYDGAVSGVGNGVRPENDGTTIFNENSWPTTSDNLQWGIGDGSGDGKYWKNLGSWNGGNPIYPQLWWE